MPELRVERHPLLFAKSLETRRGPQVNTATALQPKTAPAEALTAAARLRPDPHPARPGNYTSLRRLVGLVQHRGACGVPPTHAALGQRHRANSPRPIYLIALAPLSVPVRP